MLRNLLIALTMVICLVTTAMASGSSKLLTDFNQTSPVGHMTDDDWNDMFQNIGYMAMWINARNMHDPHAENLKKFVTDMINELETAVHSGDVDPERGTRILQAIDANIDIGANTFDKGEYNTRERLASLIKTEQLISIYRYTWAHIGMDIHSSTNPMDQ